MNILPQVEPSHSYPNFDDDVDLAMSRFEAKGGVDLDELPVGAVLDVETENTRYHIENRGGGDILISGNRDICPEPVLVNFYGSIWGTSILKLRFIGRELRMEFWHPVRGIVWTSPVREIRNGLSA
jgi:hypothetical protein